MNLGAKDVVFHRTSGTLTARAVADKKDPTNGPAHVLISQDLLEKPDSAQTRFIVGHELSHAAHHDNTPSRVPEAVGAMAAASLVRAHPILGVPVAVGTFLAGRMLRNIVSEGRADYDAATKLNAADGGVQTMQDLIERNKEARRTDPLGPLFYTKKGNDRFDLDHPPLTTRLRMLDYLARPTESSLDRQPTVQSETRMAPALPDIDFSFSL